jgi:Tfp pilus assembly protein PilP
MHPKYVRYGLGLAAVCLLAGGIWFTAAPRPPSGVLITRNGREEQRVSTERNRHSGNPDEGRAVRKYDAALYLRAEKLSDPFAPHALSQTVPMPAVPEAAGGFPAESSEGEPPDRSMDYPTSATLELKGIVQFGADRRAILSEGQKQMSVKEGEKLGIWTITEIGEKAVVLDSAGGRKVLTWQENGW